MKIIVSRESLQALIDNNSQDTAYLTQLIGRALVVLLNRQTADEQRQAVTKTENGIGFTGADARSGTLTAKSFLKYGSLKDWQLDRWLKKNSRGYSRIVKYHGQLNEAALEKMNSKVV